MGYHRDGQGRRERTGTCSRSIPASFTKALKAPRLLGRRGSCRRDESERVGQGTVFLAWSSQRHRLDAASANCRRMFLE